MNLVTKIRKLRNFRHIRGQGRETPIDLSLLEEEWKQKQFCGGQIEFY